MNESIKTCWSAEASAPTKRPCSTGSSGCDPGSRRIFTKRHGTASTLMVVTQNPELVAKLSKMNADVMGSKADPFYGAPTVIIVFSDSKMGTCVENGSLVMGNLMNAAHALGVDSCWIHRAREVFDSEEGKELKKQWGVPDEYIGIGHCVLGYRDCEYPTAKPRKEGFVIRV